MANTRLGGADWKKNELAKQKGLLRKFWFRAKHSRMASLGRWLSGADDCD
jgi:hypothetical protein